MPTHRLSHLGIAVADLDRATRFYCKVFDYQKLPEDDLLSSPSPHDPLFQFGGRPLVLRAQVLSRGNDESRLELLEFSEPGTIVNYGGLKPFISCTQSVTPVTTTMRSHS